MVNTNTPQYNTYIGARYVPVIYGEWDNSRAFEPLTIVTYQGASYTSRTYVPVGAEITNTDYWVETGNYNAQVEYYRQEVTNVQTDVDNLRPAVSSNTSAINGITGQIDTINNTVTNTQSTVNTLNQELVTLQADVNALDTKVDSVYSRPLIGGYLPVTQKFIRAATDPLYTGAYPTTTVTNQGFCKTPNGFMLAKQVSDDANHTILVEISEDGTYLRRGYFYLGHANSMQYADGYIYVTRNITGQTTKLQRVNYSTFTLDTSFGDYTWGGSVGYDPATNTLVGFIASYDYFVSLNLSTMTYKSYPNILLPELDAHQGGCYYDGYFYVLGLRQLNVVKLDISDTGITSAQYLGSNTIATESQELLYLQEPEDITVNNGTFYINSTIYDNSVNYTLSRATSTAKVNNATFIGTIDPFTANQTQTTNTLSYDSTKYVVCSSTTNHNNAVFMDGSTESPFTTMLCASMVLNGINYLDATGYTHVPQFGDVLKSYNNKIVYCKFPDEQITFNGSLVFKSITIRGERTNYIRMLKGSNPLTPPTLSVRRCQCDLGILVNGTDAASGYGTTEYPLSADGSASIWAQGAADTWENNPRVYATSTVSVGAIYCAVFGGAIGAEVLIYQGAITSDTNNPLPSFETTGNKGLVYLIDNSGNVVTGFPRSETVLACSDGTNRTMTRSSTGYSVTIENTSQFERIVVAPLGKHS